MITTLISTMLVCKSIILVNFGKPPFSPMEKQVIKRARLVCKEKYKGCVHKITKVGPRNYAVVCNENK
jgi:hypothetical protein